MRLTADVESDRVESAGSVVASALGLTASYRLDAELQDGRAIVNLHALTAEAAGIDIAADDRLRIVASLDDELRPLELELAPGTVTVMGAPVRVEAWYRLADSALALTATAPGLDLGPYAARFAPKIGLSGDAYVGRLIAGGTLGRPTLSVAGGVRQLDLLGLPTYDVEYDLVFDGDALRGDARVGSRGVVIASVGLDGAGVPLDIDLRTGRVGVDAERPLDAALEVRRLKLGELTTVLPDGVVAAARGHIALTATVGGTMSEPQLDFESVLDNATLNVPLGDERWAVEDVTLSLVGSHSSFGPASRLSAELDVSLGGRQLATAELLADAPDRDELIEDAESALSSVSLDVATRLFSIEPAELPPLVTEPLALEGGSADVAASWRGTIRSGVGRVEVALDNLVTAVAPPFSAHLAASTDNSTSVDAALWFGEGDARVELGGEQLPSEVAAALASGRPYVVFTGRASAAAGELVDPDVVDSTPIEARLELPATGAEELATLVELPDVARGSLSGYVDVFGTLADPEAFSRFALRDVDLIGGGVGTVGLQATYAGGRAEVDLVACDGGSDGLELHASTLVDIGSDSLRVGLSPPTSWPLRARARADAGLASLAPTLLLGAVLDSVSGELDVDVEVGGTVGRPEIVGTATVTEGELGIIPLARRLEDVELELSFSETAIQLSTLRAKDDGGVIRGTGAIVMDSFEPRSFDVNFRARDFPALDGSGVTAFASGSVRVAGTVDGASVDAVATLDEVEIDLNLGASGAGPTRRAPWVYIVGEEVAVDQIGARTPQRIVEESVAVSDGPSLELALQIATASPGVVRHQFGYVDFTIQMGVDVGDELVLDGVVGLPSGVNRVLGNQFEYRRGEIRFSPDDPEIDPAIDVLLVHELSSDVTDYLSERVGPPQDDRATIRIPVVGRLSELAADDWSIPLRSDPAMSEADTLSVLVQGRLGGDTDQESQQGVQALAQLGLGALGDRFSGGAIDTVSIEASGQTARVEGGKYVSDDVYVSGTYIRSPDDADDNNFEVTLEWILRRIGAGSLRLELRGGDRAKGGLELLYNLRRMARERDPAVVVPEE